MFAKYKIKKIHCTNMFNKKIIKLNSNKINLGYILSLKKTNILL